MIAMVVQGGAVREGRTPVPIRVWSGNRMKALSFGLTCVQAEIRRR